MTASVAEADLERSLRARGEALRAALRPTDVVVDLDETMWDWVLPILEQPRPWRGHTEHIFLRTPLLWLLDGLRGSAPEPVRIWTAGYGLRIDRIAAQDPLFARVFDLGPGVISEAEPHVVTRHDFVRAFRQRPEVIRHPEGSWIGEKVPGMPTLAGKPAIDAGRVLLDDRETNCRRFASSGPGRAGIWLRGTPRTAKDNVPMRLGGGPPRRHWATGVAEALEAVARGQTGVFVVDPVDGGPERQGIGVQLPFRAVVRDWVEPGREVARALRRRVSAA